MTQKDYIEKILNQLISYIKISPDVEINENDDAIEVTIKGDNLSFLIGMHGLALQALETYINTVSYRTYPEGKHVSLDVNDYKARKKEKIQDIAKRGIDKVRFFSEDVLLPAMTASERRLVHTFVADYDDIMTESTGNEPLRRVVIKKKS
jgi:spoIIIJ-associated protein